MISFASGIKQPQFVLKNPAGKIDGEKNEIIFTFEDGRIRTRFWVKIVNGKELVAVEQEISFASPDKGADFVTTTSPFSSSLTKKPLYLITAIGNSSIEIRKVELGIFRIDSSGRPINRISERAGINRKRIR